MGWHKAKLDCANMTGQATFGHLIEGAVPKHHHLQEKLDLFQDWMMEAKRRYNKAVHELRNEKQRQQNWQVQENLKQYKNEQPVIDLEQQLAGKLIDMKVMDTLEHKSFIPPQHLMVIDATLTMPGATLEAEYQRWINMINAMTAFCLVEEGRPAPWPIQSCQWPVPDDDKPCPPAKRQWCVLNDDTEITLCKAMESVWIKNSEEWPLICFLCLGNANLPLKERILKYTTPGSLIRHFLQKHINPPWPARGVECNVCGMELLERKAELLNHAEWYHGTVVQGRTQGRLAVECQQHAWLMSLW